MVTGGVLGWNSGAEPRRGIWIIAHGFNQIISAGQQRDADAATIIGRSVRRSHEQNRDNPRPSAARAGIPLILEKKYRRRGWRCKSRAIVATWIWSRCADLILITRYCLSGALRSLCNRPPAAVNPPRRRDATSARPCSVFSSAAVIKQLESARQAASESRNQWSGVSSRTQL